MTNHDLFDVETATLEMARKVLAADYLNADAYRSALGALVSDYDRLLREMRRLIRRSDRTELEMNTLNAQLQQLSEQLDYKARHDALTGVLNRGAVFDRAKFYLTNTPLSVIVLDIDLFKLINDEFGHPAGDAVLRELAARLIGAFIGKGDIGRVGGEEFSIILPNCCIADAAALAERVRSAIADQTFTSLPMRHVTASFGVSYSSVGGSFEDAYLLADQALYAAKRNGRNRVELATN